MKFLFWLLAVCAAAVTVVVLGRVQPGYVLLVYPPYRIEMSLVFFAALALGAFALLYAAVRLLDRALTLPMQVHAYRLRRRRERAQAALASALRAFYEGRYSRVEKDAVLVADEHEHAGLAALLAARAAHHMRDFARRERWLERAENAGPELQAALLVTRAELALEDRDYPAARDALRRLHDAGPRHIATLRMLLRAERGAGAWDEVLRLATQLAKRDAIAPALAEEHKLQATIELLRRSAADAAAFERRWRGVASDDRAKPRVAIAGARQATALGTAGLAREIIERALETEWSPALVSLYAELPEGIYSSEREGEARARIQSAERWLRSRSRDPQLLATLGRLCMQAELWGKARSFLEASLSFDDSRAARLELARLAERLGQPDEAQRHYRKAAELP
jgi:HemY protein